MKILLWSNYLSNFGYSLFFPLYAVFASQINANIFVIASSWAVYTITAGIMILLFGRVEDRIKNKPLMVFAGYLLLACGALGFLFIQNTVQLFMVQVFNAIGVGIVNPVWKTLYAKSEDRGKEAREWSMFDGGNMLFIGVGTLIGGYLVKLYGFSVVFILMFIIELFAAIVSLRLLKMRQ